MLFNLGTGLISPYKNSDKTLKNKNLPLLIQIISTNFAAID